MKDERSPQQIAAEQRTKAMTDSSTIARGPSDPTKRMARILGAKFVPKEPPMTHPTPDLDELERLLAQQEAHEWLRNLYGDLWDWCEKVGAALPALIASARREQALREALEPFARVADEYDDREDDSFEVWQDAGPQRTIRSTFELSKFRLARAALADSANISSRYYACADLGLTPPWRADFAGRGR